MPTALTHAVVGASLTALAPAASRSPALAAGLACAAAAPDLDVIGFALGVPYEHPVGHRGLSHGLPFAALVGALAWPRLGRSAFLVFLAVASHGFLDAFTDAGLGIGFFVPLHDGRFFFPWRPIRTSPLDPSAFFSAAGARVLLNEIVWVWLPLAALAAVVSSRRRAASS